MAQTRPQAGPERTRDEVGDDVVARSKDPSVLSRVPVRGPSASLYKPLPTEKHIRVLVIRPALNLEEPIDCGLEVIRRTYSAHYKALSYSWAMENGDCFLNRVITVQDTDVTITQNLFEGLRRIRESKDTVRIWIDALCINQNDASERNSQVAQMHQIYKNARQTVVWLGEDPFNNKTPDTDNNAVLQAIDCLRRIREPHEIRTFFTDSDDCICPYEDGEQCICHGALPGYPGRVDWPQLFAAVPGLEQYTWKIAEAFKSLFGIRYWTRRWIVQEYASEPKILLWGDTRRTALSFSDAARLSSIAGLLDGLLETSRRETFHRVLMLAFTDGQGDRLFSHLYDFREMQCSDDRDLLYSLLSLSNPLDLPIDYDCTLRELNYRFSCQAIAQGYWYAILMNSGLSASRRALEKKMHPEQGSQTSTSLNLDLPTWVADLRHIECSAPIPDTWLTNPKCTGDALVMQAFFVAVFSHSQDSLTWTVSTGNEYMQHGDAS